MIQKIETNLLRPADKEYHEERAKFIRRQIEFGDSKGVAEAKWDEEYPKGYESFIGSFRHLNAYGEQQLVDRVNQIIDVINKLDERGTIDLKEILKDSLKEENG